MEVGREDIDKFLALMERSAMAQEALITLATEERQIADLAGPPFCPHCGHFNPTIQSESGGGPLGQFILVAQCRDCNNRFFAVPQGWEVFTNPDEANAYQEGRTE